VIEIDETTNHDAKLENQNFQQKPFVPNESENSAQTIGPSKIRRMDTATKTELRSYGIVLVE
jgi:hypothetical protein